MNIVVVGLGYVGLTTVACSLRDGHKVYGVDVNQGKINKISSGQRVIFEPEVWEELDEGIASGMFHVFHDINAIKDSIDIIIVSVGTPSQSDGSHDMSYIVRSTKEVADYVKSSMSKKVTVVYRSTIKPGTMSQSIVPIFKEAGCDVNGNVELVYNPEFLREGTAVFDYYNPARIVMGTYDSSPSVTMGEFYKNIDSQVIVAGYKEAEITKFIDNTFHALKVAFANEVGRICESLGISVKDAHNIFVSDTKLNISDYYLKPGGAFGGSCLPKDLKAFGYISKDISTPIIESVEKSNEKHKSYLYDRLIKRIKKDEKGVFYGLSFKKNTDDLRESNNLQAFIELLRGGYNVEAVDPYVSGDSVSALEEIEPILKGKIKLGVVDVDCLCGYGYVIDANGQLNVGDVPGCEIIKFNEF